MKKSILFFIFVVFMTAVSCQKQEKYWAKVVLPHEENIQFKDSSVMNIFLEQRFIIFPLDTTEDGKPDLMIPISYQHLINRICYLRLAYPERDIEISYLARRVDSTWLYEAKFAHAVKRLDDVK